MPSIFTRIVQGEIPAYKVAETEKFLAFLDAFPLKRGHVLVIPKKEIDYLFDMPQQDYAELLGFAYDLAHAMKAAIPCNRVSMQVIGLEVPHAHIHLIPINSINDCDFKQTKLKFSNEEFQKTASEISTKFQAIKP